MVDKEYRGIMVFMECRDGKPLRVGQELLGKGRDLADTLKEPLTALIPGEAAAEWAEEALAYGADRVVTVSLPELNDYRTEPYTKALHRAVQEYKPEILLVGATSVGRDLAPRLSARIHTGLTADCTGLEIDEETGNLLMTRPAFGGNLMATIICPEHRPQISTVRPGVMCRREKEARPGEVEELKVVIEKTDMNVEILEEVPLKQKRLNIEEAQVLVSGGRGIGDSGFFSELETLAEHLSGTVSASRATVDAGWIEHDRQVGQTGKTVRPDLYLACGISGAIQHLAGMEDAEFIVAINKDPDAPIFDVADLGIVSDVKKVVPHLQGMLAKHQAAERA